MDETSYTDFEVTATLIKTMALLCVRNTKLEDIHAGILPYTRTGDYSDVFVIDADGRKIPWPRVSHFDDDEMRELMREVVDRLYTFETLMKVPGFLDSIGIWMRLAKRWDDPKLDDDLMAGLRWREKLLRESNPDQ